MSKRSTFARRPMDAYDTPRKAVAPLKPFLADVETFAEPCFGNGRLLGHLRGLGLHCTYFDDIKDGADALDLDRDDLDGADVIITNPPWTRSLLHPLIDHLMRLAPTWLLYDADWIHNQHACAYLPQCSHIVSVGRVKWMPDSPSTGKDNAAWYRFTIEHEAGPRFIGRDGQWVAVAA